jgi:hypothetical protein
VCSIVGFAVTIIQTRYGAGRHRGDVWHEDYEYGMLVNFVNQPIYMFATKQLYQRLILGVMVFMLIYTVVCFFVSHIASSHLSHAAY